jgi:hypothetical protein
MVGASSMLPLLAIGAAAQTADYSQYVNILSAL